MKRRYFLQAAGLSAAGIGISTYHAKAEDGALVWRIVSDFPETLDIPRTGIEIFAVTLAEITNGAFRIELASSDIKTLDAVKGGQAQLGYTTTGLYTDRDPIFAIGSGMPFSLNARQFNGWLLQQGGHSLLNSSYRQHGIYMLAGGNMGALPGGWFQKEITNVQDFAGRRVSVLGLGGQLLARYGAKQETLFPADIGPALAKSQIDIAQWGGPYDDEQLNLNEYAPFYYYPGWLGSAQLSFLINLEAWNALPKHYQAALAAASARAGDAVQASYDTRNAAAIKRLVAGGTKLRQLPQSVLSNLYNANETLAENIASRNAAFKTLYDSVRSASSDAYLWWHVAEYTYDNFMIRSRTQG